MKGITTLLIFAVIGYFSYDMYSFYHDESSPYLSALAQVTAAKGQVEIKEKKLKEAKEFFATLEAKRAQLRSLSEQLVTLRSTLSENLDVPAFMKLVFSEARRIGLSITGLSPKEQLKKPYYVEQSFNLNFQGVYVQLIAFLDRLSQSQRIVRIDDFRFKPRSDNLLSKYIDLDGTLVVKTYYYVGSKEDDLANPKASSATGDKPK